MIIHWLLLKYIVIWACSKLLTLLNLSQWQLSLVIQTILFYWLFLLSTKYTSYYLLFRSIHSVIAHWMNEHADNQLPYYPSSSSSSPSQQSDNSGCPWSFKYYTPPISLNGYLWMLAICRMNDTKPCYKFILLRCDLHDGYYTDEHTITCHLSPYEQETLVNLCVHYQIDPFQSKMFILKAINDGLHFELDFKINLQNPTIIMKKCKDIKRIADYESFLMEPAFDDWDTRSTQAAKLLGDKTIYKMVFSESGILMTKHEINVKFGAQTKLSSTITKLHQARKYKRIKDAASGKAYLVYYCCTYRHSTYNKLFIIPLIPKDFSVINAYNIRKKFVDIAIYDGLVFCLTHFSRKINIISMQAQNQIGQVRTYIQRARFKTHLLVNKRVMTVEYTSAFAERQIPPDVATLIDSYIDIAHFKYELILFSKYTQWTNSGDDEVPTCINMNKIMSHLQYLCLV